MTPGDENKLFQLLGEIKEATFATKKDLAAHVKQDEEGNRLRDRIMWMGLGGLAVLQLFLKITK